MAAGLCSLKPVVRQDGVSSPTPVLQRAVCGRTFAEGSMLCRQHGFASLLVPVELNYTLAFEASL